MTEVEVLAASDARAIDRAVAVARQGGILGLPTDTVYGVAADAWNGAAVERLYEAKGRSRQKSIPVLLSGAEAINEVAIDLPEMAVPLVNHFWPGPLTVVVTRRPELPSAVSPFTTVGLRAPDQEFALRLLKKFGPLAATSANRSGQPSSTTAAQVVESLGTNVDLVVDGGSAAGGEPSTVIDCTADPPVLIRKGPVAMEDVLDIWKRY